MADRKPLVFLSDNSVGELPASDSVSWAWLSDVPEFATRWPTWGEVTGKPAIPSSSDYVATSGNQSNLSGNKSWTGTHEFVGSAVTPIQVVRNNSNVNSLIQYTTNRGSVWAGYGNTGRGTVDHFAVGGSNNLTGGDLWFSVDSAGAYVGAEEVYHTGNLSPTDFASSSNFNYIGNISGGSYYDYLPSDRGVSYLYHAAGNSPTDAPASPARQTALLAMDTNWGTTQLAITNEDTPQVFVRGNGAIPWNRVWTAGDFDPTAQPASNITSGTFAAARIPNLNASKITAGTLNAARIPATLNETHFTGNITTSGSVIVADGTGIVQAGSLRSYSGAADISSVNAGGIRLMPNGFSTSNHTNIAANGNMTVRGTVTATNQTATSDPRLKDDIKKVKARRELIEKLEYFSFKWKKDGVAGRSVMADKVQEIAPEHVHVADDEMGTLSVDKGALALEMVMALIEKLKGDGITD